MQKYAKVCSDPISVSPMHSYAAVHLYTQNMQIYVKHVRMKFICKICTPRRARGIAQAVTVRWKMNSRCRKKNSTSCSLHLDKLSLVDKTWTM